MKETRLKPGFVPTQDLVVGKRYYVAVSDNHGEPLDWTAVKYLGRVRQGDADLQPEQAIYVNSHRYQALQTVIYESANQMFKSFTDESKGQIYHPAPTFIGWREAKPLFNLFPISPFPIRVRI